MREMINSNVNGLTPIRHMGLKLLVADPVRVSYMLEVTTKEGLFDLRSLIHKYCDEIFFSKTSSISVKLHS